MARKVNSPFNNVSIHTDSSMGAHDDHSFYNAVLSEIQVLNHADEFSSAYVSNIVAQICKKSRTKPGKQSHRFNSKNLDPLVDLIGPGDYLQQGYY
jgi:hypothetical protein